MYEKPWMMDIENVTGCITGGGNKEAQ